MKKLLVSAVFVFIVAAIVQPALARADEPVLGLKTWPPAEGSTILLEKPIRLPVIGQDNITHLLPKGTKLQVRSRRILTLRRMENGWWKFVIVLEPLVDAQGNLSVKHGGHFYRLAQHPEDNNYSLSHP